MPPPTWTCTHRDVRPHPLDVLALDDRRDAALDGPADRDLRRRGLVRVRDRDDVGVAEEQRVALPEGRVRREEDVPVLAVLLQLELRQTRVDLDLVVHGDDRRVLEQDLEVVDREVGHADGPHFACGACESRARRRRYPN